MNALSTRRGQSHNSRSYWFVLVTDTSLTKVDSNRRRYNKNGFIKRQIKLEKYNTDPVYFRQRIVETFPELSGVEFSLWQLRGKTTELTPIGPEINNAQALFRSELNRSCVYLRTSQDCGGQDLAMNCLPSISPQVYDLVSEDCGDHHLVMDCLPSTSFQGCDLVSETAASRKRQHDSFVPDSAEILSKHVRYSASVLCAPRDVPKQNIEAQPSSMAVESRNCLITCGQCHQVVKDPRTLPCLDSFCLSCLENYRQTADNQNQWLACPTCGEPFHIPDGGLTCIPVSDFVDKMAELSRIANADGSDGSCEICSEMTNNSISPAVRYCLHCRQKMCSSCDKAHQFIKATRDHTSVDIGLESCQEIVNRSKTQMLRCSVHDSETPAAHCHQCRVHICQYCIHVHNGHEVELLTDDGIRNCWAEIEQCKDNLYRCAADKMEHHKELEQELDSLSSHVDDIKKRINEKAEALITSINEERSSLLSELGGYRNRYIAKMEAMLNQSKSRIAAINNSVIFGQELISKGSTSDALLHCRVLSQRAATLTLRAGKPLYNKHEITHLTFEATTVVVSNRPFIGVITSSPGLGVEKIGVPTEDGDCKLYLNNNIANERLLTAAKAGECNVVEQLIARGASVNHSDSEGSDVSAGKFPEIFRKRWKISGKFPAIFPEIFRKN